MSFPRFNFEISFSPELLNKVLVFVFWNTPVFVFMGTLF